jgi:hypothetical protein
MSPVSDVPVLVVGFNRPERVKTLLDRLREVKPARVYVAVDGARKDVPGEGERVAATREQVGTIDWPCDVRTLFRDRNLGCGLGVSGAISWLFEQESRGVILEDDVLPHPSFFPFCDEMLERYESEPSVWAVSGCNLVPPRWIASSASYRFATVPHIWGWATWQRSWSRYRYEIRGWRRELPVRQLWQASGRSPSAFALWSVMFDSAARGAMDTWAVQAVASAFATGGLTVTSNVNLVDNVGFGTGATHTDLTPAYLRPAEAITFPLTHPHNISPDQPSDAWTRTHVLGATPFGLARQAMRLARRSAKRG